MSSLHHHFLYDDLLQSIFLFLCPDKLLDIQLVCKHWLNLCFNDIFAKQYLYTFFGMDDQAKERLRILLSTDRPNLYCSSLWDSDNNMNNFKNYVGILKILTKSYATPGDCVKYAKIGEIFCSFNKRKIHNMNYVKEMIRKVKGLENKHSLTTDFVKVSLMDVDDIEFNIKNAHCWFYFLSETEDCTTCVAFSYCGFPVIIRMYESCQVEVNGIIFNNDDEYIGKKKKLLFLTKTLTFLQCIFDIGYEPIGYDGIDESFIHVELVETFYSQLFSNIGRVLGVELELDNEANEELWNEDDLEDCVHDQYGENALSSFVIGKQPPTKKRKATHPFSK